MTTIFLLTGWGVGIKPLADLKKQLENKGYQVLIDDLPYSLLADEWLDFLAKKIPMNSYWLGYSLGGQLLAALTLTHSEQCLGLITLGSNVSFKAVESWEYAMPAETFHSFRTSYQQAPDKTIKRFFQLVAKGDKQAKERVTALLQSLDGSTSYEAGLWLLDSLNNKEALQVFSKPQYHLFADGDALVPIACAEALQRLLPNASITIIPEAGHCFPISHAQQVASAIEQFINRCTDAA